MISENLAKKLALLLGLYKPGQKKPNVRDGYAAAVTEALAKGTISENDAELLTKLRLNIETWSSEQPPAAQTAYAEWVDFNNAANTKVPIVLLQALLSQFPKGEPNEVDWTNYILESADQNVVNTLVKRHLVTPSALKSIAKKEPARFYASAGLDALLARNVSPPRAIWREFAIGRDRPKNLIEPHDALVRSFAYDRSTDSSKWLVRFLGETPAIRRAVLSTVMRTPASAFKLARQLTLDVAASVKRKTESPATSLFVDWLKVCKTLVDQKSNDAATAMLVIGLFRLAASVGPSQIPKSASDALWSYSQSPTESATLAALELAEAEDVSSVDQRVLVVRGGELYRSVQAYLEGLSVGVKGEDPSGRGDRFERYRGRKEVIDGLLSALNEEVTGASLRDAVEVALFNAGVQPHGSIGEEVSFDHNLHQPDVSGILPGDRVQIVAPGRILGGVEKGLVLSRARVTMPPSGSGSQPPK